MLYAHLIEDIVANHIYECSYFHVNGYTGLSKKQIRDLEAHERIDILPQIYKNQQGNSVRDLVDMLRILNRIRNHLTHAFFPDVGKEFQTEEGIDQTIAMLKRVAKWESACFALLFKMHGTVVNGAIKHSLRAVCQRQDRLFDARVARSKIQKYLNELENKVKD